LLTSDAGNVDNILDLNLWFATVGAGAAEFLWNGTLHTGFAAYLSATSQDGQSSFADPLFLSPGAADFHLGATSPAIDLGNPSFVAAPGEVDLDGGPRVNGARVDAGADEATICGNGVQELGEQCDDGDLVDGDGCDSNCTTTACGNGIVTAGEQCDDGNASGGDCCAASCQLEPDGFVCDDGDACTTVDLCASGVCAGAETAQTGCRSALASSIKLLRGDAAERSQVPWQWKKGAATSISEFGDPIGAVPTSYALCIYDASGIILRAAIPGGGLCRGKPCWSSAGVTGFHYRDRDATPDGITSINLTAGATGKASIKLKAKGATLAPPPLPVDQNPAVTLQLSNDAGMCWQSVFTAPATRNDAGQFKDAVK
jgi:cysteine-rich repeat protein